MKACLRSLVSALILMALSAPVWAQPSFSSNFDLTTIGPGSRSELVFTINNASTTPADNLAFSNALPASVTIADPLRVLNECGGTLTAPAGGSSLNLTGGQLGASQSCQIRLDVTSSVIGTHMNTTGDLTSDQGNSGTASADLTVNSNRPGITAALSATQLDPGNASTLTITLDNTQNGANANSVGFALSLPGDVTIASPTGFNSDCTFLSGPPAVTAGSSNVNFFNIQVTAGAACTIDLDLLFDNYGSYSVVTSNSTSFNGAFGFAAVSAAVEADALELVHSFIDDPVAPGDIVTIEYTLTNFDRSQSVTNLSFTHDLNNVVSGMAPIGLPLSDVCGAGSSFSSTSPAFIPTLSNGSLAAGESCTFQVSAQVPGGATAGDYASDTSSVTGDLGGSPIAGSPSTSSLIVSEAPTLEITALNSPAGAGSVVSYDFTLTNNSSTSTASDIAFNLNLTQFLSGVSVNAVPASGFCGSGSFAFVNSVGGSDFLNVTGANLAAGANCTFTVDLQIPQGAFSGTYSQTTSDVSATVDGSTQVSGGATISQDVVEGPSITMSFAGSVMPGDTVDLTYEITGDAGAAGDSTGIGFTHDLSATLAGLSAIGLPQNDICGTGSQLSGTSLLTLSGGTVSPTGTCSFTVTLQVPAAAPGGVFASSTSVLTSTTDGVSTTNIGAASDLVVSALTLTKQYIDSPTYAGSTLTARYTLENVSAQAITGGQFTDNVASALSGLAASSLPAGGFCGPGSTASGTTFLTFSGLELPAGTNCQFDVVLDVPSAAASGNYGNATSAVSYSLGGTASSTPGVLASFDVDPPLLFSQQVTDSPAEPGGSVTVEFTITNQHPDFTATGLSFTQDLDAALAGLAASGLPVNDVCGSGSQLSGTSVLTLTGGNLAALASCTFQVTLNVPSSGFVASEIILTSSSLSGTINSVGQSAPATTATFEVLPLELIASYSLAALPGGQDTLDIELTNLTSDTVSPVQLLVDLQASLPGVTAASLPLDGYCGASSTSSSNSGVVQFSNLELTANQICSFAVTINVPATAVAGSYDSLFSQPLSSGLAVGTATTAALNVVEPTLSASFAPGATAIGGTSTLTLTIDNTTNAVALNNLSNSVSLPAGLEIASPTNAASSCTGAAVSATAGGNTVSLTSGSVGASATCDFSVDVLALSSGNQVTTAGLLSTSLGSIPGTTASLNVSPLPGFSAAFTPPVVFESTNSTLTFTIDNSASAVNVSGLTFNAALPAPLVIANPANASTTCTGGTLTAASGTSSFDYAGGRVSATSSCTVSVDVAAGTTPGSYLTTSSALTSEFDAVAATSATLTVNDLPILSKAFTDAQILVGDITTLTLTVDNTNTSTAVTGIGITDNLPAGLEVAATPNASTSCTGGTLTAAAGSTFITYTGGTVAGSSTCTVQVDLVGTASGDLTNVTDPMATDAGQSNIASAEITVTTEHTVGGTLTGLATGNTVDIQLNSEPPITLSANGGYSFPGTLLDGSAYSVAVVTQPSAPNQICTVSNSTGSISAADVTNVDIDCVTQTYSIGGALSGLAAGNEVVLQLNGSQNRTLLANGNFVFATPLDDGSSYTVAVLTQPSSPDQTCVVSNASGTIAGANVTNLQVTCSTDTFSIGGSVTGLEAGNSVTLALNGTQTTTVSSDGGFTFATPVPDGSSYEVLVQTQPTSPNQVCSVSAGTGTVASADVTDVSVTCSTETYSVGGNVSGLATGNEVVLQLNGSQSVTVSNDGVFTFPTALADGTAYSVSVLTQPTTPDQTCQITDASGTIAGADISNVAVVCSTDTFFVFGSISGLTIGQEVTLQINDGETIVVSGNGDFSFPTPLDDGSSYTISIVGQSAGAGCSITGGGSGSINGGDATDLAVACAAHLIPIPTNNPLGLLLLALALGLVGGVAVQLRR